MQILRTRSGRGADPDEAVGHQEPQGDIVKYNHSKWIAIVGDYGGSRGARSADLRFVQLEQPVLRHRRADAADLQRPATRAPYFTAFDRRGASASPARRPVGVSPSVAAYLGAAGPELAGIPREPTFGKGIYKYLTPEGD